ncbi:MAG: sigma 54-interacting transcriptional regulator [Clostridia bacterium]|nr:sigma 54-interacting transcriptional regulator [Clostridia bacterium]
MNISRLPMNPVKEIDFVSEYYASILDAVDQGVCIIDTEGQEVYANEQYKRYFNYGRNRFDELLNRGLRKKASLSGDVRHGDKLFHVQVNPIMAEKQFKGLIGIYQLSEEGLLDIGQQKMPLVKKNPFETIIGEDPVFVEALLKAEKGAKRHITVMIRGESGTGKEMIAKEIHHSSKRMTGPFVAVNCAAIPENLIESELFGHEKGAFTGAHQKKVGKFEMANGGTLFLDEIGDLPMQLQVKLLRVLQERELYRVGGVSTIPIDVRIVAATHKNLEAMIEEGSFREDLYYRLNVIQIELPPLRERRSDIPLLVRYFADQLAMKHGIELSHVEEEVIECMSNHGWRGNIRELKNVLEQSIVLMESDTLTLDDLPKDISKRYYSASNPQHQGLINYNDMGQLATMEEYEMEIIQHAISKYGSFNRAGKQLGLTHKTVASKARKYNFTE